MGKKRPGSSNPSGPKKNAKKTGSKPSDRHKGQPIQLRMHALLREQLDKLAERNLSTRTSEIVIAIRKHLAENGLWPVPQPDACQSPDRRPPT